LVNAQNWADLVSLGRWVSDARPKKVERPLTHTVSERQFSVRPKDVVAPTTQRYVFPNAC